LTRHTRQNELKTDEKRKVDFVAFVLTPEQKKLADKERIEALQKLVNQAADFSQALSEKDANFKQVAEKFKVPVQTTDEFTPTKPDPKLGPGSQLANTAFQLTQEDPNSEPVQATDGYYIMHLANIAPARPLTIEEAKPKIQESLTATKERQAMSAKAAQVVHDLREGMKAGEPLAFSAEKANVKPEKVTPFILLDEEKPASPNEKDKDKPADKAQDKPKDLIAIKNAAASLQPGDVSEFFPWEDGGIIVVLEKRDLPDETKYGPKKKELADRISNNKREIVFYEWLRSKQREAGILKPQAAAANTAPS